MQHAIGDTAMERVLRRDRLVTLAALIAASLLAWAYLLSGAGMEMLASNGGSMSMPGMDKMLMPGMATPAQWTPGYAALMFAMWTGMMVAMMLPSAAPLVLLYATIERRRRHAAPYAATALFIAAYLMLWLGFSLAATAVQWLLERYALLSPTLATTSSLLAGAVLVGAGLYQFTPLKHACLRHCRSPLEFIARYWRRGPFGIGLRHGAYCIGCCWMIMLLLFVGGIMNLVWVALIAAFVLAEKTLPCGEWLSYALGAALIVWGGSTLYLAGA